MRGTVYVIGVDDEIIGREIISVDGCESEAEFILAAQEHLSRLINARRLEFGPIGPPWRKV